MRGADLATLAVAGGFADPVFTAQAVFRALMEAQAHPGRTVTLGHPVEPPAPLAAGPAAIALALADADTRLWLAPSWRTEAVAAWIAFQCGAPLTDAPAEAVFALAPAEEAPDMALLAAGCDEYPDRSTTLVIEVAALAGGAPLVLRGPGIDGSTVIAPQGLPSGFVEARRANRQLFPRGVDVVLVSGAEALALPRSTHVADTTEEAS